MIVREGLESTTLRDISREGGFTTGVLMHYFPDKQALIAGTFAATSREWIEHARAALAEAATVPQLLSAFVAVAVPREPERREEWRLWAEMWTYAGRDRDFEAELEAADALWEREIHAMLRRVRDEGFLPAGLDLEMEAAVLARLVDGLGSAGVAERVVGAGAPPPDRPPGVARPAAARGRRPRRRGGRGARVSGPRTAVVGGLVAADYGVFAADILIAGGRIAAVGRDPEIARGADEVIDASGLVVLPGAIDPHAHFEDPGHTEREDFTTGTSAAAAGGITTVIEHPLTYPPVTTAELYRAEARHGRPQGRGRLRPVGGAVRAGAARDGRRSGRRAHSGSRPSCRSRSRPTRM